jgi:uroporphyrinogen-III synthase
LSRRALVLESRMPDVLADLLRRAGWEPVCVPAVMEVDADLAEVRAPLQALCDRKVDWVVLQTGVGTERLQRFADRLGLLEPFLEALRTLPIVVRGPKPTAVLQRWGIRPALHAPSPHTTAEVCAVLDTVELQGRRVFVQHYGERNEALCTYLLRRGAHPVDAVPYRWAIPQEEASLREAVRGLVEGSYDALLVTSRPQVTHLFQVAEAMGLPEQLREALTHRVCVAAVGPVARQALEERGVRTSVVPEHPKMAPLVHALQEHLQQRTG